MKQQQDSLGLIATFTYDAMGNRLTQTDGNNNTTTLGYDENNRLVYVTDASGKTTQTLYDKASNVIATTDRNGKITSQRYDDVHRPIEVLDALGNRTTSVYDQESNLISLTDAKNNLTLYFYDDLNRRMRERYADDSERQYTYDKVGNILTRLDQQNRTTSYVYDDLYRLLQRNYPSDPDDFFTYDKAGRMLTAIKGTWSTTFTYDNADRITQSTQNGQNVAYAYDTVNRIVSITYPGNNVITEKMDLRGRYDNIKDSGNNVLAQYTYDLGNRLFFRNYNNGVTAAYSYNANDWVTSLTQKNSGNNLLAGVAHTYDNEGNKLTSERLHETNKSEAYGYDLIYRLTGLKVGTLSNGDIPSPTQTVSYNLDPVGNWNSVTDTGVTQNRTHNELNEITSINATSLSHDATGNLTDDGTRLYTWDEEKRLTRVTRKSDGQTLMTCQYDALSRRVVKVSQVPVARETRYIYDRSSFRVLAELDGANALQKSYVWGADISGSQDAAGGIGGLIAISDNTTGRTLQPLYDSMGNIIALTDASGTVTASYRYSAYGELLESSGPDVDVCSLRFSTQYFDSEAGIYYYGYRYLSPGLGRWLNPDPLQYAAGMNMYEAFMSAPTSYLDYNGDIPFPLILAALLLPIVLTSDTPIHLSPEKEQNIVKGIVTVTALATGYRAAASVFEYAAAPAGVSPFMSVGQNSMALGLSNTTFWTTSEVYKQAIF